MYDDGNERNHIFSFIGISVLSASKAAHASIPMFEQAAVDKLVCRNELIYKISFLVAAKERLNTTIRDRTVEEIGRSITINITRLTVEKPISNSIGGICK